MRTDLRACPAHERSRQPDRRRRPTHRPGDRIAVYPLGSTVNDAGHLEIGGCDAIELAREFGTPAYVYAPDDIRARARAYLEAFAAHDVDHEVLYASKAAPITAVYAAPPRGGTERRRRLRRRAPHRPARRLRPRADLHARQQQVGRRAPRSPSSAGVGSSSSTRSTRSHLADSLLDRASRTS